MGLGAGVLQDGRRDLRKLLICSSLSLSLSLSSAVWHAGSQQQGRDGIESGFGRFWTVWCLWRLGISTQLAPLAARLPLHYFHVILSYFEQPAQH